MEVSREMHRVCRSLSFILPAVILPLCTHHVWSSEIRDLTTDARPDTAEIEEMLPDAWSWKRTVIFGPQWSDVGGSEYTTPINADGYIRQMGPETDCYFEAQLNLPTGAHVGGVSFYVYDTSPGSNWSFAIFGYEVAGSSSYEPYRKTFATGTRVYSGGYTYFHMLPDFTIRKLADFNGDGHNSVVAYTLRAESLDGAGSQLRLWGAVVLWELQVSPGPATPTFSDVSTNHWAFSHIEALADSGISAGCGNGKFCPGSTVSRAEMAVFLSKALGLYWNDIE